MNERNDETIRRQRSIPTAIWQASHTSPHIAAAIQYYMARGESGPWERSYDVLRADVARLTEECERRGYTPPTLPIGPWPAGAPAEGSALTSEQATALLHAAEVHALRVAGAVRAAMCDDPPPIVVRSLLFDPLTPA